MRISDWSSDVCSSDLRAPVHQRRLPQETAAAVRRRLQTALPPRPAAAGQTQRQGRTGEEGIRPVGVHRVRAVGQAAGPARRRAGRIRLHRRAANGAARSEEHTSELQSLMRISYAVFCLKKKNSQKLVQLKTHKSEIIILN